MSTVIAEPVTAACFYCRRQRAAKADKRGGTKLPMGWKREGAEAVCRDCWTERYLLRSLTFAVASPVSGTWAELDAALKPLWAETTKCVNWMMTECYARDLRREDQPKLPPMPRVYLYPEARILFPGLPPTTVASIEQAAQRKYRAKRYDVIWVHRASLPTARYPQPYPVNNQSWKFWFNEQGQPLIDLRLGSARFELRLKSGPRYWRQISGLRRMAERGEMAIYKAGDGTLLVKLVGWLRREPLKREANPDAALYVRTGDDYMLAALDARNEQLWIENCDHVRRWSAEHRKQLQRWSEDQKAEQRPQPSFAARRTKASDKYHNRMQSAIQEIAAHVGNLAARRHYAKVVYDDSKRWVSDFPYAALEARLKVVLDEKQIVFVKAAGETNGSDESEAKGA